MNVARLRKTGGYENISVQQQENIFAISSLSIPTSIPKSRPRPSFPPK